MSQVPTGPVTTPPENLPSAESPRWPNLAWVAGILLQTAHRAASLGWLIVLASAGLTFGLKWVLRPLPAAALVLADLGIVCAILSVYLRPPGDPQRRECWGVVAVCGVMLLAAGGMMLLVMRATAM